MAHGSHDDTFEEALREAVDTAPHLGFALAVHAVLLALLLRVPAEPEPLATDYEIRSEPEVQVTPLVPPQPVEPDPVEPLEPLPVVEESPEIAEALEERAAETFRGPDRGLQPGAEAFLGVGIGHPEPGGDGGPPGIVHPRTRPPVDDGPVLWALRWLAHHQSPDGHWSAAGFSEQCGRQGDDGTCDGAGNPQYDVGVTGLALLAFLGAGHDTRQGEFADEVLAGLDYLRRVQAPDGNFGVASFGQHSYDHLIATLAMIEAYTFDATRRRHLGPRIERALDYTARLRSPGGAWRYAPDHPDMADPRRRSDTSVTGWAVLVLATARDVGFAVDEAALADALDFLDEVTDPETGRAGYTARGGTASRERDRMEAWPPSQTESLTAVGLLSRIFADPGMARPGHLALVRRGVERVAALPPLWDDRQPGRIDLYSWYYGSYALYQWQEVDARPWRAWQPALIEALARHQHAAGERRGSWDPQVDPWGHLGGRVYTTALGALCLEAGYRYATVLSLR